MDNGSLHLRAQHPRPTRGVAAADAIATLEGIPAPPSTLWPPSHQRRAEVAISEGRFERSLVPVLDEDGTVAPRPRGFAPPGTTVDSLAQLPAKLRGARRHAARRGRHHVPGDGPGRYPGLEIEHVHHAGTPPAWSTAPRRSW